LPTHTNVIMIIKLCNCWWCICVGFWVFPLFLVRHYIRTVQYDTASHSFIFAL